MRIRHLWVVSLIFCTVGVDQARATEFNKQQLLELLEFVEKTCRTVTEAKGSSTTAQIEGTVKADLPGLMKKLLNAGASTTGKIEHDSYEGLSREATAAAMADSLHCRERLTQKMLELLSKNDTAPSQPALKQPAQEPIQNLETVQIYNLRPSQWFEVGGLAKKLASSKEFFAWGENDGASAEFMIDGSISLPDLGVIPSRTSILTKPELAIPSNVHVSGFKIFTMLQKLCWDSDIWNSLWSLANKRWAHRGNQFSRVEFGQDKSLPWRATITAISGPTRGYLSGSSISADPPACSIEIIYDLPYFYPNGPLRGD